MSETLARRAVTRGKVTAARTRAGRVLVDMELFGGERRRNVELLLPTGVSALPAEGADLVVLEVAGNRQHLVAIVADDPALRVTGLTPGEWAVRVGSQQVVFRQDGLEITNALRITITASGPVNVTTDGIATVEASRINLGAGATKRVKLQDDSVAAKVYAE